MNEFVTTVMKIFDATMKSIMQIEAEAIERHHVRIQEEIN